MKNNTFFAIIILALASISLPACAGLPPPVIEGRIEQVMQFHPPLPRAMLLQDLNWNIITRRESVAALAAIKALPMEDAILLLLLIGEFNNETDAVNFLDDWKAKNLPNEDERNFVVYTLDVRSFEHLALNHEEIKRYIEQLQLIIAYYRQDIDNPKSDQTDNK